MSSNGFARCRAFDLRPSRTLAWAIGGTHALAALSVAVAQLPWPLRIASLLALALSARRAWTRHATRSAPAAVVRLGRRDDGSWSAQRRDGTTVVGELADDSFISRYLVVVGITDGWCALFTPVPADTLATDDHRRLRVWVKWQPSTESLARRSRRKGAAPTF